MIQNLSDNVASAVVGGIFTLAAVALAHFLRSTQRKWNRTLTVITASIVIAIVVLLCTAVASAIQLYLELSRNQERLSGTWTSVTDGDTTIEFIPPRALVIKHNGGEVPTTYGRMPTLPSNIVVGPHFFAVEFSSSGDLVLINQDLPAEAKSLRTSDVDIELEGRYRRVSTIVRK